MTHAQKQYGELIGESPLIQRARELALMAGSVHLNAHIVGETGTGKELVARLAYDSLRHVEHNRTIPFVAVNCAAIPPSLAESEFFGYDSGAFTDARRDRRGILEQADGGLLLLDEAGHLDKSIQFKLLRALEYEYHRLGSTENKAVDMLIVTADNRPLDDLVLESRVIQQLYHRMQGLTITLPPLRYRGDDIKLLIDHYAQLYSTRGFPKITDSAYSLLQDYPWPGNVRELSKVLRYAVKVAEWETRQVSNQVVLDSLSFTPFLNEKFYIPSSDAVSEAFFERIMASGTPYETVVESFERNILSRALNITNGNKRQAARLLDISRTTFIDKITRLNVRVTDNGQEIDVEEPKDEVQVTVKL